MEGPTRAFFTALASQIVLGHVKLALQKAVMVCLSFEGYLLKDRQTAFVDLMCGQIGVTYTHNSGDDCSIVCGRANDAGHRLINRFGATENLARKVTEQDMALLMK